MQAIKSAATPGEFHRVFRTRAAATCDTGFTATPGRALAKKLRSGALSSALAVLVWSVALLPPAQAIPISFTGHFMQDDNQILFTFTVPVATTVTIDTTSFAMGGFNPVVAIFGPDAGLSLFAETSSGGSNNCPVGTDPATMFQWDACLSENLQSGNYVLSLTEDDNLPFGPTFADGFQKTGQGNFTGPEFLGSPGSFILVNGAQRTSLWTLEISGASNVVQQAVVPEPGTFLYGFTALAALAVLACRRQGRRRRDGQLEKEMRRI